MIRQLRPALGTLVLCTVILGFLYPLAVTAFAQGLFGDGAEGSVVRIDGQVRGSSLIAQPFDGDEWFQPRPSAVGYSAAESGGSNLGPSNPLLVETVEERGVEYRERNAMDDQTAVPVDAVTASGSGLDPHISTRNAALQAPRVAAERGLDLDSVMALIGLHTQGRSGSVLGEPRVNVVTLNAALERMQS